MNGIGNVGNYINLLAQQYSRGSTKQPSVSEAAALDNISLAAPVKAADVLKKQLDAYQKRWADTIHAIAQLRASTQDTSQLKKAAAAEKVKRIKAQIEMLMKMAGVGDPKAIAREIAQLAKELAAAAQEYASAGGGGSPQESTTSADTTAATSNTTASTSDTTSAISGENVTSLNTTQSNSSVAADVSGAASSEPTQSGTSDAKALNATPDAASTASTGVALAEGSRQYQDNLKQQNNELQNKIAGLPQKSSGADADSEFAAEVRNLEAKLKALAKLQEMRLHQAGDKTADGEISKINQAISEVEKNVSSIISPSMEAPSPVNIFA